MATLATQVAPSRLGAEERFFMTSALVMAATIVAGFSLNAIMGRSSFSAPAAVHFHALLFMGWLALYVTQNGLVATGNVALHRRLGWLSALWVPAMIVTALHVIVSMVRRGAVPFFFKPVSFLVMDVMVLATFVTLTAAAIRLRRMTAWHRRFMFCGMAVFTANGLGRLLPMPLLIPWAWEAAVVASLLFPLWGMISDQRRTGRIHPAWFWGLGIILGGQMIGEIISASPVGLSIYDWVAAGSPGAQVSPIAYPAPPGA
jgi:hypothetical protein